MIRPDDRTPEERRADVIADCVAPEIGPLRLPIVLESKGAPPSKGLVLPLSAEDNRPIKDAAGQLVSIVEHAGAFAHALNCHDDLRGVLRGILDIGKRDTSNPKYDGFYAEACLVLARADAGAKLPPVQEAGEQAVADILDDSTMTEAQALQFAKEIKAKFRVYAR